MKYEKEINRRKTFAIISHPDAGKTTLTEKLLLFGGAIQTAGAVKSNKIKKHGRLVLIVQPILFWMSNLLRGRSKTDLRLANLNVRNRIKLNISFRN